MHSSARLRRPRPDVNWRSIRSSTGRTCGVIPAESLFETARISYIDAARDAFPQPCSRRKLNNNRQGGKTYERVWKASRDKGFALQLISPELFREIERLHSIHGAHSPDNSCMKKMILQSAPPSCVRDKNVVLSRRWYRTRLRLWLSKHISL